MRSQLQFILNRLRERLWVKPLVACILSVAGVLLAHVADALPFDWKVPEISQSSVIDMLKIVAASMLGIATFAVASMVAAYASTGQSATARAFPLIVADDVSQNALSTFVGAFIFSIVALSATTNDYYGKAGRFTLFVLLMLVLSLVVLVFVRWVDSIARLGRLGAVMAKVEQAASDTIAASKRQPCLGALCATGPPTGLAFHGEDTGYLQRIDMHKLQHLAERCKVRITVAVLPGTMVFASRPLGYVLPDDGSSGELDPRELRKAFVVGPRRHFDDDPRFGLVVLSEIACRALSPGVNDPGTAIGVLDALHRLLAELSRPHIPEAPPFPRIEAAALSEQDLFDDAFGAIGRDGAGLVEVAARLQRVLGELGRGGNASLYAAARRHADWALARSESGMHFRPDLDLLRRRHAHYWGTHRPEGEGAE